MKVTEEQRKALEWAEAIAAGCAHDLPIAKRHAEVLRDLLDSTNVETQEKSKELTDEQREVVRDAALLLWATDLGPKLMVIAKPHPTDSQSSQSEFREIFPRYVQNVPDQCDHILWRGEYYDLPITPSEGEVAQNAEYAQRYRQIMSLVIPIHPYASGDPCWAFKRWPRGASFDEAVAAEIKRLDSEEGRDGHNS